MKRILSLILTLTIASTVVFMPTMARAYTYGTYDDLTYKAYDNHIEITDCGEYAVSVDIPAEINGLPVTSIGDDAFRWCESLTSVAIPDSVTSIGGGAFQNCTSLTSVTIPNSVTSIGAVAFYGCTSLASINIPDSVTSIGFGVFIGCGSLYIEVSEQNRWYSSSDGVLFNKDKSEIISYAKDKIQSVYSIPGSVTSIGESAFENCTSLTSVTIPGSVTSIGESAFFYCTSLLNIIIPDSVIEIGGDAFSQCKSLSNITIPDSVTSIRGYAFWHCDGLTSVTIPDRVTSIGEYAFFYCTSLPNIIIPDSVIEIGGGAFSSCTSLTSVKLGNGVTSINGYAFSGCTSLPNIAIPNSVTSIGGYAFENCTNLTSVILGNGITSIGLGAFDTCNSLKDVYYTGTEEQWHQISIGIANERLTNATIHYNSAPPSVSPGLDTDIPDFYLKNDYCIVGKQDFILGRIKDDNNADQIENIAENIRWEVSDPSILEITGASYNFSLGGKSIDISLQISGKKAGKAIIRGHAPNGMEVESVVSVEPEMKSVEHSQISGTTIFWYSVELDYPDAEYLKSFLSSLKCEIISGQKNAEISETSYVVSENNMIGYFLITLKPNEIKLFSDNDVKLWLTSEGGQTSYITTSVDYSDSEWAEYYKNEPSTWDEVEDASNDFIDAANKYMNGVLERIARGNNEEEDPNALRKKAAAAMMKQDEDPKSAILSFGISITDDAKLSAYEALYDALEEARGNSGVNLDDIDFSGDIIKNNTRIVEKISEAISSVEFHHRKYGDYTIDLQMLQVGFGGGAKWGSMFIYKNGTQVDTVQICSSSKDTENVMRVYLEQLKDLFSKSLNEAVNEVISALTGKTIGDWGKSEIKKIIEECAPIVQRKGVGDIFNAIKQCSEVYKYIQKFINAKDESPEKQMELALDLYSAIENDEFEDKSITDRTVNGLYVDMRGKYVTLKSNAYSFSQGIDVEKKSIWDWFASFKCPVNIYVYNKGGILVGSVEGDYVEHNDEIMIEKSGDVKKVYLPSISDYDIKLVATDSGKLDCTFEQYNNGKPLGRANFYDIDLYENKELLCTANISDLESEYINLSISADGNAITPNEYISSDENAAVTISTQNNEGGSILGAGKYARGDGVNLTAIADDNYSFIGWYVNNNLVSTDITYTLCAKENITVQAVFRKNYETDITNFDESNDSLTVTTSIKNNTSEQLAANAYIAVFDKNDILQTANTENIIVNSEEEIKIDASLSHNLMIGDEIRMYLWDENQQPLTDISVLGLASVSNEEEPQPTSNPSPTSTPTASPTATPTPSPTHTPTPKPTATPTPNPTTIPTATPTSAPTQTPTPKPTVPPTDIPTYTPTPPVNATEAPRETPVPDVEATQAPPLATEIPPPDMSNPEVVNISVQIDKPELAPGETAVMSLVSDKDFEADYVSIRWSYDEDIELFEIDGYHNMSPYIESAENNLVLMSNEAISAKAGEPFYRIGIRPVEGAKTGQHILKSGYVVSWDENYYDIIYTLQDIVVNVK